MVSVCKNRLKNRLNTAILVAADGVVFGMAGFTRLSANRRQNVLYGRVDNGWRATARLAASAAQLSAQLADQLSIIRQQSYGPGSSRSE